MTTITKARQELAEMRNRAEHSERKCSSKAEMFERLYGPESDHMYL